MLSELSVIDTLWLAVSPQDMWNALFLFVINTLSYILLTWDYRAVAQANYVQAFWINLVIAGSGFFIFRKIAEASTLLEAVAYTLSGGVGVVAGIWVSKVFLKE